MTNRSDILRDLAHDANNSNTCKEAIVDTTQEKLLRMAANGQDHPTQMSDNQLTFITKGLERLAKLGHPGIEIPRGLSGFSKREATIYITKMVIEYGDDFLPPKA